MTTKEYAINQTFKILKGEKSVSTFCDPLRKLRAGKKKDGKRYKKMNAREAREITQRVIDEKIPNQLNYCRTWIKRISVEGKFSVVVSTLYPETIKILENDGYKIEPVDYMGIKNHKISW